ncbi:MAG: circadian clock protein KaiC [Polyangiales bacterium]
MTSIEKLATQVPGFDIVSKGGIPKGRSTLIAGRAGVGKSVLALQMACNLAKAGHKVLLVAIEENPEDLIVTADTFGWDLSGLLASKSVSIANLTRLEDATTVVIGDYDASGLIHRIEGAVRTSGADVLVLDSTTALFTPRPAEEQLRTLFFQVVSAFRRLQLTAIITAEAPADYGQTTVLGVEDFVCDLIVIIRNVVDGERRRRSLEVVKYRRTGHYKGEYPCTITAHGMTIFPLDARSRDYPSADDRFSSGIVGLDGLTQGGWLRDSIVLVRGPTGSGKTTLAGTYALAGAKRGERVIYYGFEEPKAILVRNFSSVGLDFTSAEQAGHLHVECRYPEATSPEDLLIDLRVGLEEIKPSLVVLDSISSIEHSTSVPTFRHFMIGLASLLREHARSALLTQTVASQMEADGGAPYLSTIADAIVVMDYTIHDDDLHRSIRVLKMRGSKHDTRRHPILMGENSIHVTGA